MNISPESAKVLLAKLDAASRLCDESLKVVKENEGIGILQVYARLTGQFLGNSHTNIMAPLWSEYPELEPEYMKGLYKEPAANLSNESQIAITAFLSAAKMALTQAENMLIATPLPFGGTAEFTCSMAEIEEFLNHPRFHDDKALPNET